MIWQKTNLNTVGSGVTNGENIDEAKGEDMKIDDKILQVLSDAQSHSEWDIACHLYDFSNTDLRSKRGAWIRCIVQALWRLYGKGRVGMFWQSHGNGVAGDRIWFGYDPTT